MRFHLSIFLLAAHVGVSSASEQPLAKPDDFGILEWIHNSEGGHYNPKQDFRYEIPGDPNSVAGIFANQRINEGEVLCEVPWDKLLKGDDPEEEGQLCCGTGTAAAREMRKGEKSENYAPYAMYLNAQDYHQLPSAWSDQGKKLLQQIVGGSVKETIIPPDEPTEWLDFDWYNRCQGDRNDTLSSKAALLVVQRSDDYYMIPAYDFYNHRNGKWTNTETRTIENKHHITTATRTIEEGEQIYISYNMCKECSGRTSGYGTAEILRDYGFVEIMPQRWHFSDDEIEFDLDEDEFGDIVIRWKNIPKEDDDKEMGIVFLRRQIRRLRRITNLYWNDDDNTRGIPQSEWDIIWDFYDANMVAMEQGIMSLEKRLGKSEKQTCSEEDYRKGGVCSKEVDVGSHYDPLDYEIDDLDYVAPTCDNEDIMEFNDYKGVYNEQTHYQRLNFMTLEEEDNICMDLDDIVQICSNYRPQYHEYVVHAAARFVDKVKRVIFIGGGDSMLLHEALKYPSLELVVGLELDQIVTRQSFKYFHTQPHFDDDRVEWWFGDATKSLLLLPKEYWQSFDLVLVDLSETVMSLSVTKELDVFDALTLLLNEDGVMVKNELYMEKFSQLFDHTIQLYYPSPIICSQCLVIGSNKVDFLHYPAKDHGVETLLYEPAVTEENRFDFMHDYRKNDAREQGKCGETQIPETPQEQESTAGIIEIVEAENTSVPLDASIAALIQVVIRKQGFTPATVPTYDSGLVLMLMEEGYILARLWPDQKYCGFDISLWSGIHKMKELRAALVEAVGSTLVSSYRIVVGGMYGTKTWKEDQKMIGPQIAQSRNCEEEEIKGGDTSVQEIMKIALNESVNLAHSDGLVAAVLCGDDASKGCWSADVLGANSKIAKVIPVWSCSGLEDDEDASERAAKMYACEQKTMSNLNSLFGPEHNMIDIFAFDTSVSYPMLQILNSILDEARFRGAWLQERHVFMAISANPSQERWRRNFLDRYRKQHSTDPGARGEFLIEAGDNKVELGVVSCGDDVVAYNLETEEFKLREQFAEADMEVSVELRTIHGGLFIFDEDFDGGNKFVQSDYDNRPGQEQYAQQEPLGSQHIFQVVPKNPGEDFSVSADDLDSALEKAMEKIGCEVSSHHRFGDVGEGVVIAQKCKSANAVLVWNGREHIDLNLFTFEEESGIPTRFASSFLFHAKLGKLKVGLRDDMPRGVGRAINFKSDLEDK